MARSVRSAIGVATATFGMQVLAWAALFEAFGRLHLGYYFFDISDITAPYYPYAVNLAHGMAAFRDFFIEYPPLFVPLLASAGNPDPFPWFALRFALLMALYMSIAGVVTALAAMEPGHTRRGYVVGALFALFVLALGPIIANRYDATVALVIAVAMLCMMREKWLLAGIAIGIGFALKITPAMLIPIVLLLAPTRKAVYALVGFAVAALAPFVWVLMLGGQSAAALAEMLAYHLTRPLEIESLLATPLWIGRLLGAKLNVMSGSGSQVIASRAADALANSSAFLLLAALGVTFWLIWRRRTAIAGAPRLVALCLLVTLLASLVGSKVLSPQYFIWLVPALAIVAIDRKLLGALLGVTLLLTQVLFPANYSALAVSQLPGPVAILVARNLALLLAFALGLWALWTLPAPAEPAVDATAEPTLSSPAEESLLVPVEASPAP